MFSMTLIISTTSKADLITKELPGQFGLQHTALTINTV